MEILHINSNFCQNGILKPKYINTSYKIKPNVLRVEMGHFQLWKTFTGEEFGDYGLGIGW